MAGRFISILLMLVLIGNTFIVPVLVIDYLVHQSEITANHCVNKDNPDLKCNGQCHLNKQVKPVNHDDGQEKEMFFYVFKYSAYLPFLDNMNFNKPYRWLEHNKPYINGYDHKFSAQIFHPPVFYLNI